MSKSDIAELVFVLGLVLSVVYLNLTIFIVTIILYCFYAVWEMLQDVEDDE